MKAALLEYTGNKWSYHLKTEVLDADKVQLVLCFGSKERLQQTAIYKDTRKLFPQAIIALASTAGEIYYDSVKDDSIVAAALYFETTQIIAHAVNITDFKDSYAAAAALTSYLPKEKLAHILVLSDGNLVNGSELAKGFSTLAAENISVTGGLAGDAANFSATIVGLNEEPVEGKIIAIGFYGNNIEITHGSQGGWDSFGIEKRVTAAENNVLYEIENQNALSLYKKYLGAAAVNLPAAALLFPLSVIIPGSKKPTVRTILSINQTEQTMTFAGNVPVGSKVRFMKANLGNIISAASGAAACTCVNKTSFPVFSLLISCVGRKLMMGNHIKDEITAVHTHYQQKTLLAGFYSYGEIAPFNDESNCHLYNQTMTITSFYEHTNK